MTHLPNSEARTHLDLDAGILVAASLASKRRPAELVEIVAAADLVLGFVPSAEKLGAAIGRLSARGLIRMSDGGFMLTDAGRELIEKQPRKASREDIIAAIKVSLSAWRLRAEHPPVPLPPEQLDAAIRAHKATRHTGGNVPMPKPTVVRHFKVEGRWRRVTKAR